MTDTKNQTAEAALARWKTGAQSGTTEAWWPIENAPNDGRWHFVAHPACGVPLIARRESPGSSVFEWFFDGSNFVGATDSLGSDNEDAKMSNDAQNQTSGDWLVRFALWGGVVGGFLLGYSVRGFLS